MRNRFHFRLWQLAPVLLLAAVFLGGGFGAAAQESPAAKDETSPPGTEPSPTEVLCAGRTGDDLDLCQEACTELPASPGCLFVRRFGAVGWRVLLLARETNRDPEEVGRDAGMDADEARRLMLVLDWDGVIPHPWVEARLLTTAEEEALQEAAEASWEGGKLLQEGKYPEALQKARQGLSIRERILGPEHPYTMDSLNNLAVSLLEVGDDVGAEPLLRRTLEVQERVLGLEHPSTLTSVINLAALLLETADYAGAEQLCRRALRASERVLGSENPITLDSMDCLAGALLKIIDYEGAESLLRRALAARERVLGSDHRDTLTSVHNLAHLLRVTRDHAGAEPLYRRALGTSERVLGLEHPVTLGIVNGMAVLLEETQNYASAERLFRRALEGRERVLGLEHPDTLGSVDSLAVLLLKTGDYTGAEPLCRRALEAQERILGKEHPDTLTSVNNLAGLLVRTGDYAGAEPLFRRALEARERVLGKEHPDTLTSVDGLAVLLLTIADYAGAEPLYRRALEARESVLGKEHSDTLTSVNGLAGLMLMIGDYASAEPLYRRALEARERVLGAEHPDTLNSVNGLASLLHRTGEYLGAESLYRRALEAQERVLGPEHPNTLSSVNNLAVLLVEIGDYVGAEPLFRRVLEAAERVLGLEHPDTLTNLNNLAGRLLFTGDYAGAEPLLRRALKDRERVLGPEHRDTLQSVMNLSFLEWVQGHLPTTKALVKRGVRGIREHFQKNMDAAGTDESMRLFLDSIRGHYFAFLSLFADPGDEQTAFMQVLSWQGAATMATTLVNDLRRAERNAPAEQKALFARYGEAARERMRLLMAPVKDEAAREERARGLQTLDEELARLEQELSSVNADFRRRRAIVEATPEGVCASLKAADAGMVVFVRYDRFDPKAKNDPATPKDERVSSRYLGLVVKPEGCEVSRIDLDAESIDAVVETYRTAIERMQGCIQARTLPPDSVGHVCEKELAAVDIAALTVREKVWDPVAGALPASGRIYVVLDGSLVDVPFGSLPTGTLPDGKTKYLIEDRDLAYLPSPRDALRLGQSRESGGEGALVMGEVDYTTALGMPQALSESARCGRRGCKWGSGPMVAKAGASGKEGLRSTEGCGWAERTWVAGVGKDAPDVAEVLGRNLGGGALLTTHWRATEALLRQEMPGKRILHLSSHGFYSTWEECRPQDEGRRRLLRMAPKRMEAVGEEKWEPDPLTLTGLVLAGANAGATGTDREDPANDGVLSGREIADLDLTTTDVVVLAACETGRGDRTAGEGALGLGKAFLVAGARQVVMALWQVPDAHTAALFRNFYERVTAADREPVPSAVATKTGSTSHPPTVKPERPTDALPRTSSDPVAALRQAQLTLLNDARDRLGLSHSSYLWGAFVPMVRGN